MVIFLRGKKKSLFKYQYLLLKLITGFVIKLLFWYHYRGYGWCRQMHVYICIYVTLKD